MDVFVKGRASKNNQALITYLKTMFSDPFYYGVYDENGNELFPSAGTYNVTDWVTGQFVDTSKPVRGIMLAPPYPHVMLPIDDTKVRMIGYHDHIWTGDFVLGLRTTREIGHDSFIFEKIDGSWLATSYVETVYEVSPASENGLPIPTVPRPPSPAGHAAHFPTLPAKDD